MTHNLSCPSISVAYHHVSTMKRGPLLVLMCCFLVFGKIIFFVLQPTAGAAAAKPMGRGAFLQQVLAMQQGGAAPTPTSPTPVVQQGEHIYLSPLTVLKLQIALTNLVRLVLQRVANE